MGAWSLSGCHIQTDPRLLRLRLGEEGFWISVSGYGGWLWHVWD